MVLIYGVSSTHLRFVVKPYIGGKYGHGLIQ